MAYETVSGAAAPLSVRAGVARPIVILPGSGVEVVIEVLSRHKVLGISLALMLAWDLALLFRIFFH